MSSWRSAKCLSITVLSKASSGAPMWTAGKALSRDLKSGSAKPKRLGAPLAESSTNSRFSRAQVEEMEQRLLVIAGAIEILDDEGVPLLHCIEQVYTDSGGGVQRLGT